MVFSQTSHKTQGLLKVVEIDRLKAEKSQQVNVTTEVVTNRVTGAMPTSQAPPASCTEVRQTPQRGYLKEEPSFEDAMYHETDCELFQDLVQWCSDPAKEEQPQTIDPPKKSEDRTTFNNDTLHTAHSPLGCDAFYVNSSHQTTGFYNTTPVDPLSPNIEGFTPFNQFLTHQDTNRVTFQEPFLDISKLPVVMGDLIPAPVAEISWPNYATKPLEVTQTYDTNYNKMYTHNTLPFIDQDDTFDSKFLTVTPQEVESSNNIIISEFIVRDNRTNEGDLHELRVDRGTTGLSVDVSRAPTLPGNTMSTPELLSFVEQMDKEKLFHTVLNSNQWSVQEPGPDLDSPCSKVDLTSSPVEYEPITPKSESHVESDNDDIKHHSSKRKHDSEDSDETYTPYTEQTTRKYKRRKPSVPIKDKILALKGSQQLTKAKRGRPPKRRESAVSSACSVDENSCAFTHENKYRELRDKNNEASKRSRMNRKLKELQMEQLADELEERNKKLKVKADILEEMTKKLKDALMTAILQKKD